MTEFQKKTYEKFVNDVDKFIPESVEDQEKFTVNDIIRCIIHVTDTLTEKELDTLLTIGTVEGKRQAVIQRMANMLMSRRPPKKEEEEK